MNKTDRGVIKWMPFYSITGEEQMIKKLIQEKEKIKKPNLSIEQIEQIEQEIVEAFYENTYLTIFYFQDGFIKKTCAKITHIDTTFKKVYLSNQKILLFFQILEVHML